jgi:hypothetical protein
LLWVVIFVDKKKDTNFARYSTVVAKYGHPIKVRSNCVIEHSLVQEDMERVRPNVYKLYLTCSLVHN